MRKVVTDLQSKNITQNNFKTIGERLGQCKSSKDEMHSSGDMHELPKSGSS